MPCSDMYGSIPSALAAAHNVAHLSLSVLLPIAVLTPMLLLALSAAATELGPPCEDAFLTAAMSDDTTRALCRAAGSSVRRQDTLRSDAPLASCASGAGDPLSWPSWFPGVLMGSSSPAGGSEESSCFVKSACGAPSRLCRQQRGGTCACV